ncbi:CoA pyrophosphatase [Motilimonas pumila]|nr:CoA pyrophosphatase [Motilimonas pumila]
MNHLTSRYRLHLNQAIDDPAQNQRWQQAARQSAVLVGLVKNGQQWQILLTQRAFHLRHHGGQIAFPGGKLEPSDASLTATALRESEEEIQLKQQYIQVLGNLPPFYTATGFEVTPVVATLSQGFQLVPDRNEVADIFFMPLQHAMQNRHHSKHKMHYGPQRITWIPYQGKLIWGATAAIIDSLCRQVSL